MVTKSLIETFDDQLLQLVDKERQGVYGHPALNFGRIARLQAVIDECTDPELGHVLDMIAVKIARLIQTPSHFDSWVDIAGYARTAILVLDRRENDEAILEEILVEAKPGGGGGPYRRDEVRVTWEGK